MLEVGFVNYYIVGIFYNVRGWLIVVIYFWSVELYVGRIEKSLYI